MENPQYKTIGFLSELDPMDKRSWSGTLYKIYESIQKKGYNIVYIPVKRNFFIAFFLKIINRLSRLFKRNFSYSHTYMNISSISFDEKLINDVDMLFIIGAPILSKLKVNKPIIYLIDATFNSLYNYYPEFSDFWKFNINQGNNIEKKALETSTKIIAASDWTKNSIIHDYNISPKKIEVIEFGANINNIDIDIHTKGKSQSLNILFLGVEWGRKGGDIAVQTCELLINQGLDSSISIVGIKDLPSFYNSKKFINNIGFLNKNEKEEYDKFIEIISNSDILLLPTKAECAGIAFSEASAYGLPIFTYDTGGIANYVINGVNGYRLPLNSGPEEFAKMIKECVEKDELENLKKGCIKTYKETLNWDIWAEKFNKMIYNLR